MKKFKVYKILRTNDDRHYIGVTKRLLKVRLWAHKCDKRTNPYLNNWINKYWKEIKIIQLFEFDNLDSALNCEKQLVPKDKIIRKQLGLLNLKEGGGGNLDTWNSLPTNKKDLIKKKIGDAHRGKIVSSETRKKLSESHKGKKLSEKSTKKRLKSLKTSEKLNRPCTFVSPCGDVIIERNIAEFSRMHGLEPALLLQVKNNKRRHTKGWSNDGLEFFVFKEPGGNLWSHYNITKLSKTFKLNKSHMCRLAKGLIKEYRGWKLYKQLSNVDFNNCMDAKNAYINFLQILDQRESV